jgi:hypothetical protein
VALIFRDTDAVMLTLFLQVIALAPEVILLLGRQIAAPELVGDLLQLDNGIARLFLGDDVVGSYHTGVEQVGLNLGRHRGFTFQARNGEVIPARKQRPGGLGVDAKELPDDLLTIMVNTWQ